MWATQGSAQIRIKAKHRAASPSLKVLDAPCGVEIVQACISEAWKAFWQKQRSGGRLVRSCRKSSGSDGRGTPPPPGPRHRSGKRIDSEVAHMLLATMHARRHEDECWLGWSLMEIIQQGCKWSEHLRRPTRRCCTDATC